MMRQILLLFCLGFMFARVEGQTRFITGYHVVNIYKNGLDIIWDPFPNATLYEATVTTNRRLVSRLPWIRKTTQTNKISMDLPENLIEPYAKIHVIAINGVNITKIITTQSLLRFNLTSKERPLFKNVMVKQVLSSAISFSWDHFKNATYHLQYSTGGNSSETNTTSNDIVLRNLTANSTYTIQITWIKTGNEKLIFPIMKTITVKTLLVPNFTISNIKVTKDSFQCSWNNIANATLYHFMYGIKDGKNFTVIPTNVSKIVVRNLTSFTKYNFYVEVKEINGETPVDVIKSDQRSSITDPDFAISPIRVTNNSFECSWNTIGKANLYHFNYGIKDSGNFTAIPTSDANILVKNLTTNALYDFHIEVKEIDGKTPADMIKSDTRFFFTVPEIVISDTNVTKDSFQCAWNDIGKNASYHFNYGLKDKTLTSIPTNKSNIFVRNLTSNTEYDFYVELKGINGEMPINIIESIRASFKTEKEPSGSGTDRLSITMMTNMLMVMYLSLFFTM